MERASARNRLLSQRIQDLERELGRVQDDIGALSKAVSEPDRKDTIKRLRELSPAPGRPRGEAAPARAAEPAKSAQGELFGQGGQSGTVPVKAAPARPGAPTRVTSPEGDERFANYFTTGGLQAVRPLREERRIQRNRAILMVVVAVLLLCVVVKLLF
jgi:hypothetical protein